MLCSLPHTNEELPMPHDNTSMVFESIKTDQAPPRRVVSPPCLIAIDTNHPLGWHPPFLYTKDDLRAQEAYYGKFGNDDYLFAQEEAADMIPVGLVTGAIRNGRDIPMTLLHRTLQNLILETKSIENFLIHPPTSFGDGSCSEWERELYYHLLRQDLNLVVSAINGNEVTISSLFPSSTCYGNDEEIVSLEPLLWRTEEEDKNDDAAPPHEEDEIDTLLKEVEVVDIVQPTSPEFFDMEIDKPRPNDVILGRGAGPMQHKGNVAWRNMLATYKAKFSTLERGDRKDMTKAIVARIRNQKPPGRFLQQDADTKAWFDVGDTKAEKKAAQALRDMLQVDAAATKAAAPPPPALERLCVSLPSIHFGEPQRKRKLLEEHQERNKPIKKRKKERVSW